MRLAQSFDVFDALYQPLDGPDGTLFRNKPSDIPPDTPASRVWSIIEGDEGLWLRPGYRLVNCVGYVVCDVPRAENATDEEYRYDD